MFSSSGASPSCKMWYAEQYPTRIRTNDQSVVEGLGGRFFGGVVWTAVFPVLPSKAGLHVSMMIARHDYGHRHANRDNLRARNC